MADLIEFPGPGASGGPGGYRLHRFAPDDGPRGSVPIRARDDAEARRQAGGLAEGLRAELWSGDRLLERFPAPDHPIAVSLRLLDGPAAGPGPRGRR